MLPKPIPPIPLSFCNSKKQSKINQTPTYINTENRKTGIKENRPVWGNLEEPIGVWVGVAGGDDDDGDDAAVALEAVAWRDLWCLRRRETEVTLPEEAELDPLEKKAGWSSERESEFDYSGRV